jgi:hypothetical protein
MNEIPIRIAVSEPWDFGEAISWHEQLGSLVRVETEDGREIGLILLISELTYMGRTWSYLLVFPRSDGMSLSAVDNGASVPCNFVGLAEETVETTLSEVLQRWRGGLAFIGDLARSNR